MKLQLNEHIKPNSNSQRREKWTNMFVKKTKEMEITGNQCDIKRCIMKTQIYMKQKWYYCLSRCWLSCLFLLLLSLRKIFNLMKFTFRRMSGMTILINFHFLQFLLILIFIFTICLFLFI